MPFVQARDMASLTVAQSWCFSRKQRDLDISVPNHCDEVVAGFRVQSLLFEAASLVLHEVAMALEEERKGQDLAHKRPAVQSYLIIRLDYLANARKTFQDIVIRSSWLESMLSMPPRLSTMEISPFICIFHPS
jgi:hypothetical protein